MVDKDSSVEKMKKKLYVRNVEPVLHERRALHEDAPHKVAYSWDENGSAQEEEETYEMSQDPQEILEELHRGHIPGQVIPKPSILDDKRFSADAAVVEDKEEDRFVSRIIKAVLIASFLFFIFAVGLAGFYLIGGKNQVSCKNVDIAVTGPHSIPSGKKLVLDVSVTNNNPVPMKNASLEVVFPDGARDAQLSSSGLPSSKEQVGTIEVGEHVRTSTTALLFGQEQTEQEIKTIISYEIEDSSASFTCEQPYTILISTSPVSLTVEGLEEISSGQELELEVSVTSNSEETVPDLRIVAEYPYGFEFISSVPEPTEDDRVWEVGDLIAGKVRTVKIRGIVRGQGVEARTITFSVGEKDTVDAKGLATILQKNEHPLLVTRPFMELSLELDDSANSEVTSTLGEQIRGNLKWKNALGDALHDVEIEAHFTGVMLNLASVTAGTGFFRSIDRVLIWTPQTADFLRNLEAGQEGELPFKFSTKPFEKGTRASNPSMSIEFVVRARRISDNIPVQQNLQEQSKRTILFNTDLDYEAYALYGVGSFTNTGPHPPEVNERTTYTIVWDVTNSTNNADSVILKGELPVYMEWLGQVAPQNESVVFNPVTREVIWSLGAVARDTGYQEALRKISFQVGVTPSISQLGEELILVEKIVLQGTDTFTKNVLTQKIRVVNSKLAKDPYFSKVWGVVK